MDLALDPAITHSSTEIEAALPATTRIQARPQCRARKRKGVLPEELDEELPAHQASECEGRFWFEASRFISVRDPETNICTRLHKGITSIERQRLRELLKLGYLTDEYLRTVVIPKNDETSGASRRRAHDYALTNMLKGAPILQATTTADGTIDITDVNVDYEQQLERDRRLLFDPFRRGTHLFFQLDGRTHHTTVAQLAMFRFEDRTHLDAYVAEHEEEIRARMKEVARSKAEQRKQYARAQIASKQRPTRGHTTARADADANDANDALTSESELDADADFDADAAIDSDADFDADAHSKESNTAPLKRRQRRELTRVVSKHARVAMLAPMTLCTSSASEIAAKQAAREALRLRALHSQSQSQCARQALFAIPIPIPNGAVPEQSTEQEGATGQGDNVAIETKNDAGDDADATHGVQYEERDREEDNKNENCEGEGEGEEKAHQIAIACVHDALPSTACT